MRSIILLFGLLVFSYPLKAQSVIEWQTSAGGTNDDDAASIQQIADSGYIFAGSTLSANRDVTSNHGSYDCWVVKLDPRGIIAWQKVFGGTSLDVTRSIRQTKDSGFIMAGLSTSINGDITNHHGDTLHSDFWVVKMDAAGNMEWQQSLGGSQYDVANSIIATGDGGYIVAGYAQSNDGDVTGNHGNSDYWVVKLDSSGNIAWQKCLGGTGADIATSVEQTSDSGYIVAGYSQSNDGDVTGNHGSGDYWIVKLDKAGSIEWQKALGGTLGDAAQGIKQTKDSGYIIVGSSGSHDGDVSGNPGNFYDDYWLVKLDIIGNIQWEKSLGGFYNDNARSVGLTSDEGYIVAGYSESNNGDVTGHHGTSQYTDYWVVKLDSIGTIQWQQSLGGTDFDQAYSVMETFDKKYVFAGYSNSSDGDVTGNHGAKDCWIVKFMPEVLGVNWLNFSAVLQNNNGVLNWATTSELNNKVFVVQRSIDGQNFNTIGLVNSLHTTSVVKHYSFTDTKVFTGINYYRLKQIDADGGISYSTVVTLNNFTFNWVITNNPSNGISMVRFNLPKNAHVSIQVVSLNGAVIQTIDKGIISSGDYSEPLHFNIFTNGLYIVRLIINENIYSKNIVK